MAITDELDQGLPDPLAPKTRADGLRQLGMVLMRGFFQCAAIEDAAWSGDFELMLRTVRESREFILRYYGERAMPDLLEVFDQEELKILKTIQKMAS
jgi:hypothetical protein